MRDTPTLRAVVFDWGGVLIDDPGGDLISYCAERLRVPPSRFAAVFNDHIDAFARGAPEQRFWRDMCADLGMPVPAAPSLWGDAVQAVFRDRPAAWELVRRLRAQGLRTGFLSNTEPPSMHYFHRRGLGEHFDATVFSCAVGALKPEARIYELVLEQLGLPAAAVLMVDDRPENVAGAQDVGMLGHLFIDDAGLDAHLARLGVSPPARSR